jgi:hypothetical protein
MINSVQTFLKPGAFFLSPVVLSLGLLLIAPQEGNARSKQNQPNPAGKLPTQNYKPLNPFNKPFQFFTPHYSKTPTGKPNQAGSPANRALNLLRNAEHLLKIWMADKSRSFDKEGRPWSAIPDFGKLLKKLRPQLSRQTAYLLFVISNFSASHFRRAAHFGALFLPRAQDCLYLLPYAPYEPDFGIRREALSRMIPFLNHHLGTKETENPGKAPEYIFDPIPFLDLCRASWVPDRILAFKILAIYAKNRPKDAAVGLQRIRSWIKKSLEDKSPFLRKAVKNLIRTLEASPDTPPLGNTADCLLRLDQAISKHLPRVLLQGGFCEIFSPQGNEMQSLAKKGLSWVKSGKIGFPEKVRVIGSRFRKVSRGLRLRKVPKDLRVFGFREGDCITAINGFPIKDHLTLALSLQQALKRLPASITVEWVGTKGHERARRFHVYKKDPTWKRFHLRWRPELKTFYARSKHK